MCGIAGLVGEYSPGLMSRMNRAQQHRGPDGAGVFEDPAAEAALGHVRLAILDLTDAAAQPMHSADGRYVIVFNGEIFNYRDLRLELEKEGRIFRSTGDTEVLLQAWARCGESVLPRLNGMFAFAIWDRRERELMLVRDQFGIKPLYYHVLPNGAMIFASELKSLCCHPRVERVPDPVALQQHLAFGHASGDRTMLRGMQRLSPGCSLRWSAKTRSCTIARYWRPDRTPTVRLTRSEAVEELRRRIAVAVNRQMVSDVPLGVALSGGLDSSILTASAAKVCAQPLDGFTIAATRADNRIDQMPDDLPHARRLARHCGVNLHEILLDSHHTELWSKLLLHLDEPIVDPAIISSYLVCQAARRQGVTVLLSGQGADELFAGYPRYRAVALAAHLDGMPQFILRGIAAGADSLPGAWPGWLGGKLRRARRLLHELPMSPADRFLNYAAATPEHVVLGVLNPDWHSAAGERPLDECRRHLANCGFAALDANLDRDQAIYLPNHNLAYTDRTSMAVGVECRVPFLDLDLVQFVNGLPARWKLDGSQPKAILREAARGLVPDSIIDRKKAGFTAPYRTWLSANLSGLWNELMTEDALKRRGWFDPAAVQRLRQESLRGDSDHYMLQWALMTLEFWARQFLDANPATVCREVPRPAPRERIAV